MAYVHVCLNEEQAVDAKMAAHRAQKSSLYASYYCVGLIGEIGSANQPCKVQLLQKWVIITPELIFLLR